MSICIQLSPTRDVCSQQSVDIISFLYKQLQTLDLSPVSCRVDGVLSRETDSFFCGDGDESPQDSTVRERERDEGVANGKRERDSDKQMLEDENRAQRKMFIRLWFELQCYSVMELKNSHKQKALCGNDYSENTAEL